MFSPVLGTPVFSDRAAFCQNVVNEYFGKAVKASFMEEYLNNDTRAAVSITHKSPNHRTPVTIFLRA